MSKITKKQMEKRQQIIESAKSIIDEVGFENLSASQQKQYNEIKDSLNYIYKEMSPDTWKQMQIDDVFAKDQFSNTKQELTELANLYRQQN